MEKTCQLCGDSFKTDFYVNGKRHRSRKRTKCYECVPMHSSCSTKTKPIQDGDLRNCNKCTKSYIVNSALYVKNEGMGVCIDCAKKNREYSECKICEEPFMKTVINERLSIDDMCNACIKLVK